MCVAELMLSLATSFLTLKVVLLFVVKSSADLYSAVLVFAALLETFCVMLFAALWLAAEWLSGLLKASARAHF